MDLVPVDHDPFANAQPPAVPNGVTSQPVDHDPWAPYVNPETGRPEISVSKAPAEGVVAKSGQSIAQPSVAEQVAGFPQRAADMTIGALGPIGEAGMTVGDMLRTGHVDPRDIPQVAGGVMLGVAAPEAEEAAPLEAGAEAVAKGITAYHGSPYDFDKFDLSKIGTGEGAQAYGHGLYFAENPGTAQSYRDSLSDLKPRAIEGQPDLTLPSWIAKKVESHNPIAINDVRADFQNRLAEMQRQVSDPSTPQPWIVEGNIPGIQNILSALDHVESGAKIAPAGRMYHVSINADPEHFLDWDKPLSEQSPVVQQNLQAGWLAHPDTMAGRSGADIYHSLSGNEPILKQNAAAQLRQAGIPGIKYLDQGSRNINGTVTLQSKYRAADLDSSDDIGERLFASRFKSNGGNLESTIEQLKSDSAAHPNDLTVQKTLAFAQNPENEFTYRPPVAQTKNYVVFDDKLIDIIKKYGLAGLIAGGASHFATQPVDHDPFAAQSP